MRFYQICYSIVIFPRTKFYFSNWIFLVFCFISSYFCVISYFRYYDYYSFRILVFHKKIANIKYWIKIGKVIPSLPYARIYLLQQKQFNVSFILPLSNNICCFIKALVLFMHKMFSILNFFQHNYLIKFNVFETNEMEKILFYKFAQIITWR